MSYKIKEKSFNWFITNSQGETRIIRPEQFSDLISWEQAVAMKCGDVITIENFPDFEKLPLVTPQVELYQPLHEAHTSLLTNPD